MKAFVKQGTAPCQASLQTVERPVAGRGELILKVHACGLCGSDLHAYLSHPGYEWVRPPVTLGHEFCGTVVETGAGVEGWKPGQLMTAVAIQGCLECPLCRAGRTHLCANRQVIGLHFDGALAEYVRVGAAHAIPLPTDMNPVLGALIEPFSVAIHAVSMAIPRPGMDVAVSGPGPVGLLCALFARLAGANVAVLGAAADAAVRLPAAERLGLFPVNVEEPGSDELLASFFHGRSPELWVEASGSTRALGNSLKSIAPGGTVIVVGLYPEAFSWFPTPSVRLEHRILFSYASTAEDYALAIQIMMNGGVDAAPITAVYSLEQTALAIGAAESGKVVKAIISPDGAC